jgi:hypothetical protein
MAPVVNRLEEQFAGRVVFKRLNALDGGLGEQAFHASELRGHPGYVLLAAGGAEAWRGVGTQREEDLTSALRAALAAK